MWKNDDNFFSVFHTSSNSKWWKKVVTQKKKEKAEKKTLNPNLLKIMIEGMIRVESDGMWRNVTHRDEIQEECDGMWQNTECDAPWRDVFWGWMWRIVTECSPQCDVKNTGLGVGLKVGEWSDEPEGYFLFRLRRLEFSKNVNNERPKPHGKKVVGDKNSSICHS